MVKSPATVNVKGSQGNIIATQNYDKVNFHGDTLTEQGTISGGTPESLLTDAIAFFQAENPKGNGVIELLRSATYAYDLGVRASIRQSLVTAAAGPEKSIDRAVKDLMAARSAAGRPISEETARAKVMALMAD